MELTTIVDRKHEIRTLPDTPQFVKQRIAQAAEELNRAGDTAMHVELANEALTKFTHMLYIKDADGALANVDTRTSRLLVAAPWGNKGWKRWGLRNWEAVVLRSVLLSRVEDRSRPCLFDYNQETRTWHLNTQDYTTLQAASFYLERGAVKVAEWRRYSDLYRQSRITVQSAYRQRRSNV